ncbi:MAG: hypothetical protein JWN78_2347 [Bacteroidota bacterium]|nr:hypothetical protein [Bacteroidota bacterium]
MFIMITMYKNGVEVGTGSLNQSDSMPDFTSFSIPINYYNVTDIPDSADIRMGSSFNFPAHLGTKLFVDKLSFDGFVSAVNNIKPDLFELDGMKIFPNPARDRLIIENLFEDNKECSVTLFSFKGESIKEIKLAAGEHTAHMEVGDLSPGFYLLVMKKGDRVFSKKIIIQR